LFARARFELKQPNKVYIPMIKVMPLVLALIPLAAVIGACVSCP
jgi:hypothetical protein